jgi:excisionase family DNA binding protein
MERVTESPWLNLTEAAAYARRGKRFLLKQIHAGKLRAALVGGRREVLTRKEWVDQFVEDQAVPITASMRKRA